MENPEFLTAKEVAARLGLEANAFRVLVSKGALPQPYTLSARLRAWAAEDITVMVWLLKHRERLRKSTPDEEENDAE